MMKSSVLFVMTIKPRVQVYFHSGTFYITDGNFGLVKELMEARNLLELEPYLFHWSQLKPLTNTQLR